MADGAGQSSCGVIGTLSIIWVGACLDNHSTCSSPERRHGISINDIDSVQSEGFCPPRRKFIADVVLTVWVYGAKWLPFCRGHFQMHFVKWKDHWNMFSMPNWQWIIIRLSNGLSSTRRQTTRHEPMMAQITDVLLRHPVTISCGTMHKATDYSYVCEIIR